MHQHIAAVYFFLTATALMIKRLNWRLPPRDITLHLPQQNASISTHFHHFMFFLLLHIKDTPTHREDDSISFYQYLLYSLFYCILIRVVTGQKEETKSSRQKAAACYRCTNCTSLTLASCFNVICHSQCSGFLQELLLKLRHNDTDPIDRRIMYWSAYLVLASCYPP